MFGEEIVTYCEPNTKYICTAAYVKAQEMWAL
jgi:hypothetical protein